MRARRINANNEDLIGQRYHLRGYITFHTVEDIDAEREGVLIVVNPFGRYSEADAYAVRAAINARTARDEAITKARQP
jgi:hypothetical protein